MSAAGPSSKGLQTLRQRLVGNGKALAQSSLEDEVMNRIIREQNARLKSAAQAGAGLHLRRLIMKSSVAKVAVAAVVVLAVAGGLFLWTGTKSGVALADVLAKVEQIQAFMYKMTMHVKGSMPGMPAGRGGHGGDHADRQRVWDEDGYDARPIPRSVRR